MDDDLVARASVTIEASRAAVWDALTDREAIRHYMFGTDVDSDWHEGSPIVWRGEWEGRRYEDKGVILTLEPGRCLQMSHFSPLSGLPDTPENYHTVTIGLSDEGGRTGVLLTQDHNATAEARENAERSWRTMLAALKSFLEQ